MLNNQAVQFMKDLEKNPLKAKADFKAIILPHMMRCLRTVQVLDQELEAHALEIKKLIKANVVLIDTLKRNGVDMPNFNAIEDDAVAEHAREHRS
jgi:mRNA-degrading endonuclease YafQ of YafQ-DinJ toxin-antitoxin module